MGRVGHRLLGHVGAVRRKLQGTTPSCRAGSLAHNPDDLSTLRVFRAHSSATCIVRCDIWTHAHTHTQTDFPISGVSGDCFGVPLVQLTTMSAAGRRMSALTPRGLLSATHTHSRHVIGSLVRLGEI